MNNTKFGVLASLAALLVALFVAGCGGSGSLALPKTESGQPATIGVASTALGKILVNSHGRTLYLFKKDSAGMSACTGACASNWPPLRANHKPTVGSGANASLVGTIARPDGRPQATYNGHPLYLFANDAKSGDTNGEGVTAFGGGWYALSSSGNLVLPKASSPGGGYGY